MKLISSRVFDIEDQKIFAELSSDYNPIHLNKTYALKSIFKDLIVHGVHLLFWAIESIIKFSKNKNIVKIHINYFKPTFLKKEIKLYYNYKENNFYIKNDDQVLIKIKIFFSKRPLKKLINKKITWHSIKKPIFNVIDKKDLNKTFTKLYFGDSDLLIKLFPMFCKKYGKNLAIELISLSTLIGMIYPGRDSILSAISINFNMKNEKDLYSKISYLDDRSKIIKLKFTYNYISGEITSCFRPQLNKLINVKNLIHNKESIYRNFKALVIGGSKGIGEAITKLILLKGGNVDFTYNNSAKRANYILNSLKKSKLNLKAKKFDVTKNNELSNFFNFERYNLVFYFATPKIFIKNDNNFDESLYNSFYDYYVRGFEKILLSAKKFKNKITFYYPSTIEIKNKSSIYQEYIKAKKNGEKICKLYSKKGYRILFQRLPRVTTDQTISMIAQKELSTLDISKDILNKLLKNK